MSDPAFTQSDLFSTPATEQAELAVAVRSLPSANSYRPVGNTPLSPPTCDVTRALAEAGLHVAPLPPVRPACCAGSIGVLDANRGGVRCRPQRHSGLLDHTHDLLPDWDWLVTCSRTCQLMNGPPGSVLLMFRDPDRRRGTAGTCLVTSRRGQRTEAGL
jgi:hypothetical protein